MIHRSILTPSACAFIFSLILGVNSLQAVPPAIPFYLKDNDRVVFYGDSITAQKLYTTDVEAYIVTRFPTYKIWFVNSGVPGDTVGGGGYGLIDLRLKRDVLPYTPTVMTMMLGMNDGAYKPFDQDRYDTYTKGYAAILDTVQQSFPGIRFTLIQPSPKDEITRPATPPETYNKDVLLRFGEFVKKIGADRQATVTDFNAPVCALLEKAKAQPELGVANYIIPDTVHPSAGAHLVMAEALLKTWNAPSLVSRVEINAELGLVTKEEQTSVTHLQKGDTLSWTETDTCLPYPMGDQKADPVLDFAVKHSDVVAALNQEPLKVTGLSADKYTLLIDGEEAGTFTKTEWESGVNLALLPTPMQKQAAQVLDLTVQHNAKHFHRYECNLHTPPSEDLAKLDAEEAVLVDQQRAAAQPKPHHFELKPAAAATASSTP